MRPNYSNSFNMFINRGKNEFVIQFAHIYPASVENDVIVDDREAVGSIVMDIGLAGELAEKILGLLNQPEKEPEE